MPRPKARVARSVKTQKQARKRQAAAARPDAAQDKLLREHLLSLFRGSDAHLDFDKTIADFPADLQGRKTAGLPYSAWQLLEHMRIAQWDIVEFSRNPQHVSPEFPSGYWPQSEAPPDPEAWGESAGSFRRDLKRMEKLVSDPKIDLYARIPHGNGQTILREALLLADHNAYHLGQLLILRRLLGAWSD
jgi:DinB superfamily